MIKKFAFACLCLCLSSTALAAGATKVAVVNLQGVVLLSDAGKSGMGELEKKPEYAELKAKAETLDAELKSLNTEVKNESLTWGEEKKKQHREKMSEIAKEQQNVVVTLNRAREAVFMQLLKVMEPAIGEVLKQIIATEGIELVLDSKSAIHSVPTADITPMVVAKLNDIGAAARKKSKASKKTKK